MLDCGGYHEKVDAPPIAATALSQVVPVPAAKIIHLTTKSITVIYLYTNAALEGGLLGDTANGWYTECPQHNSPFAEGSRHVPLWKPCKIGTLF